MKNIIAAVLLLALPFTANALELKLGILNLASPLYEGRYSNPAWSNERYRYPIDDTGLVGRIEIGHQFDLNDHVGINVFATHLSMLTERDPHYGVNGVGAELVFTFFK